MYKQVLDPVSHSLGLSSIFALLPLAALFVLLGVVRLKAQWASLLALVAATAPVAFGAIAIPITTLAQVSGLPKHQLSEMVGRQCPLLALLVPFLLVAMVDGRRGLKETWPAALTAGGVFAAVQFAAS